MTNLFSAKTVATTLAFLITATSLQAQCIGHARPYPFDF